MAELRTIITLRQGTTAQWAKSEVVLKIGEVGLEYREDGSVKIKAGDNEHLWNDLAYVGSDLEASIKEAYNLANDANELAKTKVNTVDYETDMSVINLEISGLTDELFSVKERVDTFLDSEGLADTIDSLKDIQAELEKMAETTELVEALSKKADKSDLNALDAEVDEIQSTVADHIARIFELEQADINHATQYNSLVDIVTGHTATIANKANAEDVYTKSEIDTITGVLPEGKSLADLIAASAYDDTVIRGLISDNRIAINAIYNGEEKTGALVDEIAKVVGLITAEETRAKTIEGDHEERIAEMENFWKASDDPIGTIDKLAEIVNYIENDKSGAIDMATSIEANKLAIENIYVPANNDIPASGVLVNEISRVENKINSNTSAIAAINDVNTGILAVAKEYTDGVMTNLPAASTEALGLVKYDGNTIQMNESKQLYVSKVSTDNLEQGSQTLVLNGGSAAE